MLIFKISLKNLRKKLNEKLKKILTKTYDELAKKLWNTKKDLEN